MSRFKTDAQHHAWRQDIQRNIRNAIEKARRRQRSFVYAAAAIAASNVSVAERTAEVADEVAELRAELGHLRDDLRFNRTLDNEHAIQQANRERAQRKRNVLVRLKHFILGEK